MDEILSSELLKVEGSKTVIISQIRLMISRINLVPTGLQIYCYEVTYILSLRDFKCTFIVFGYFITSSINKVQTDLVVLKK